MDELHAGHELAKALYGLTFAIFAYLLKWGFQLFWGQYTERAKQSDQTRADVVRLEYRDKELEAKMTAIQIDLKRVAGDTDKILKAVEYLAGPEWPKIAKKIKDGNIRHE